MSKKIDPTFSKEVKPDEFGNFSGSDEQYVTHDSIDSQSKGVFRNVVDSFRRKEIDGDEAAGKQLAKGISKRHLILMALVTGIGTGLLVGSGQVLSKAGPLFTVIGFAIGGSFVYPTLQAAGEMAVNYSELSGGYNSYTRMFVEDSVNFAISWNYCIQWLSVISIELVTAAITIEYWISRERVDPDAWVAIFFVVIVVVNFIGSKAYGEFEFIIGLCKVCLLVGFIIMGIVVNVGGGPEHEFIGGRYWHHPGPTNNGFKGFCSVFVTACFSLGQTEFIALSAAEQPNPRQAIPTACRLVFWRIIILFLGSLTIVGLLVPYNSDRLLGEHGGGSNTSPFVLSAALHGVRANLAIFSEQGFAPKWFDYIDRAGRPSRALLVSTIIGLFAFIATYKKQVTVFNWLLAISGLSQVFTWSGICISHIRFRKALAYNNISTDVLGYKSSTGVLGSYYALVWFSLVLMAQFWIALYPIGAKKPSADVFFQNYLGAVVLIAFYVAHKLWTRKWRLLVPISEIDINHERTIFDEEILNLERQEEKERWDRAPFYKKIFLL
ncbi:General amino acid permease AGP1 [Candida viswanathii]|uniref:General amino acid permease AGP1 n=1 Tax=Candida viswanathii TaxID=5486 RepID=A0A367XWB0_9ASCO|nr:General amino acid permease AGP1 [Candida viswanathii]